MENKETRQKKDGEDMKKGLYADGQSKHVDANSENIIEEKDIIKEEKILTFTNRSFVIFVESMEDFRFL